MVKSSKEITLSVFGAGILGFGLGILLAGYLQKFAIWLILIGIIMHGWGMYKMHSKNLNKKTFSVNFFIGYVG